MKRVMVVLIAGTVLSGVFAAYAAAVPRKLPVAGETAPADTADKAEAKRLAAN